MSELVIPFCCKEDQFANRQIMSKRSGSYLSENILQAGDLFETIADLHPTHGKYFVVARCKRKPRINLVKYN